MDLPVEEVLSVLSAWVVLWEVLWAVLWEAPSDTPNDGFRNTTSSCSPPMQKWHQLRN